MRIMYLNDFFSLPFILVVNQMITSLPLVILPLSLSIPIWKTRE